MVGRPARTAGPERRPRTAILLHASITCVEALQQRGNGAVTAWPTYVEGVGI